MWGKLTLYSNVQRSKHEIPARFPSGFGSFDAYGAGQDTPENAASTGKFESNRINEKEGWKRRSGHFQMLSVLLSLRPGNVIRVNRKVSSGKAFRLVGCSDFY